MTREGLRVLAIDAAHTTPGLAVAVVAALLLARVGFAVGFRTVSAGLRWREARPC